MGHLSASEMAAHADIDRALAWHLTSNHYPPVPTTMIPACREAIDAINEGDYDRNITLPDGILWRDRTEAPAWAIAEGHHLEAFIDTKEDW